MNKFILTRIKQHNQAEIPQAIGEVIPPGAQYRDSLGSKAIARGWVIMVDCPFCGKKHEHNWNPGKPRKTRTRACHCLGQKRSKATWENSTYRIVVRG